MDSPSFLQPCISDLRSDPLLPVENLLMLFRLAPTPVAAVNVGSLDFLFSSLLSRECLSHWQSNYSRLPALVPDLQAGTASPAPTSAARLTFSSLPFHIGTHSRGLRNCLSTGSWGLPSMYEALREQVLGVQGSRTGGWGLESGSPAPACYICLGPQNPVREVLWSSSPGWECGVGLRQDSRTVLCGLRVWLPCGERRGRGGGTPARVLLRSVSVGVRLRQVSTGRACICAWRDLAPPAQHCARAPGLYRAWGGLVAKGPGPGPLHLSLLYLSLLCAPSQPSGSCSLNRSPMGTGGP